MVKDETAEGQLPERLQRQPREEYVRALDLRAETYGAANNLGLLLGLGILGIVASVIGDSNVPSFADAETRFGRASSGLLLLIVILAGLSILVGALVGLGRWTTFVAASQAELAKWDAERAKAKAGFGDLAEAQSRFQAADASYKVASRRSRWMFQAQTILVYSSAVLFAAWVAGQVMFS